MTKIIRRRWVESETEFIRKHYTTLSVRDIAKSINRSEKATRTNIERLGIRLTSFERNGRLWAPEEVSLLKENIQRTNQQMVILFNKRSTTSICHKRIGLGITKPRPYWKRTLEGYHIRRDGHGGKIFEHREIIEREIGRKLMHTERVHHINGKKDDNTRKNLFLCRDKSHHKSVHCNLERIAFGLVERGIIKFNKIKGCYEC